jgi:predicted transcriptional regulator
LTLTGVAAENYRADDTIDVLMHKIPFGISSRCDGDTTRRILNDTAVLTRSNREIVMEIIKCLNIIDHECEDHTELEAHVEKLAQLIKHEMSKLEMRSKKHVGNKVHYVYGHLIDNQHCEVKETVGLADNGDTARIFGLDVKIQKGQDQADFHPAVLKRNEMHSLVDKALQLLEQSQHLDKIIPMVEKVLSKNLQVLDDKVNDKLHEFVDSEYHHLDQTTHAVRDLFRYISQNLPKLASDASRVSLATRRYVVLSAQHYKKA